MTERKGYKICKDSADAIRQIVGESIERTGRVSEQIVYIVRTEAKDDAELHQQIDEDFMYGGGPAVNGSSPDIFFDERSNGRK